MLVIKTFNLVEVEFAVRVPKFLKYERRYPKVLFSLF